MAQALEAVEKSKVLKEHPRLSATVGKYSYRIERRGSESDYTVTDGVNTVTLPIRWAMGASSALGQTCILEKDGQLYESRVSWFRELGGLDQTMGYDGSPPADINDAAGRLLHQDEKIRCFGCHATNAVQGRHLTFDKMTPGVQCEHCHQSTEEHLAALQRVAIGRADVGRLFVEIEHVGRFHLHAIGQFEGLDSRFELGIFASGAGVFHIQLREEIKLPPLGGAADAWIQLAPSSSLKAKSTSAPVVCMDSKVRPVLRSVNKIGSSVVKLTIDGDTSVHRAGPASGSGGLRFSGGVTRNVFRSDKVMMLPVRGLKPMLNSPAPASAPEPFGGKKFW